MFFKAAEWQVPRWAGTDRSGLKGNYLCRK